MGKQKDESGIEKEGRIKTPQIISAEQHEKSALTHSEHDVPFDRLRERASIHIGCSSPQGYPKPTCVSPKILNDRLTGKNCELRNCQDSLRSSASLRLCVKN